MWRQRVIPFIVVLVADYIVDSKLVGHGAIAEVIPLVTFDGLDDATSHSWRQTNDPVMGGASSGSFEISNGLGIMNGTVAIIPKLGVPGFIKAKHATGSHSPMCPHALGSC